VARLAKRAQVRPVETKIRSNGDGDDVIDFLGRTNFATLLAEQAERVGADEGVSAPLPSPVIASRRRAAPTLILDPLPLSSKDNARLAISRRSRWQSELHRRRLGNRAKRNRRLRK
jgi:hypothetical protein